MDKLKYGTMDDHLWGYLISSHNLEKDWTYGLIGLFIIFGVVYFYRYVNNRSLITIRLFGLFLIVLTFLLYLDSFFYPLFTEINNYLMSLGYPNIMKTYFPFLDSFMRSDFLNHVRLWMGLGNTWKIPEQFIHVSFPRYDFTKLDSINQFGLHGVPATQQAGHIRLLGNHEVFVSLLETFRCMEDPAYYKSRYNITVFYVIPFLSPAESPLSAIFPWAEYSFGISLACIIFIIAIILSILYLLNFFTSLKNSDNQKMSSYECGFEPIHTNARIKFDVLYWIIGILYLIFDLEIIFIFPLATIIQTLQNPFALFVYLFFIIILTLGFIYEWKKGALKLNQKS